MLIYVDESGDLGWKFDRPYGLGGSSRFLTIAAMLLPEAKDHLPARKIKHLYREGRWNIGREKKWVEMPTASRLTFARNAVKLREACDQISYKAIVVKKQNVDHIFCSDSNKLYNYMLRLLLLEDMVKHRHVTLIPDPRSIKVENGSCLHHYLDMMLYEAGADTKLESISRDSRSCLSLQFVDMLAGVVEIHHEFKKSTCWKILAPHIQVKQLFF